MRALVCGIIALSSALAFAADAKPKAKPTAAERAARISKWQQKTGGYVQRPGVGKIVVVNCQSKVAKDAVASKTATLRQIVMVPVECIDGQPIPAGNVLAACRKLPGGANAALYVVDDPALPLSLMCPSEQWALINVANASTDPRFDRLFARGIVMAFGSGVSQYENSPMQTIRSPEDLDRIAKTTMAVDNVIAIQRNLAELGVKPPQRVTYFQACQEGWAAAPTNDIQKAVWDKVHEIPKNPMKIEFDPKRDK